MAGQAALSIDKIVANPTFQAAPTEVQRQVLVQSFPEFASASPAVQDQILNDLIQETRPPSPAINPSGMGPTNPALPPQQPVGPPLPGPQEDRGLLGMLVPEDRASREKQLRHIMVGGGAALGVGALGAATLASGGAATPFTAPGIGALTPIMATGLAAALGSAGGSVAADVAGIDRSANLGESVRRAGSEAAFDLGATGIGSQVGPLVRAGTRKLHGLPDQLTHLSQRYGIPASVEDVTHRAFVKRMRNVVGRFPIVSRPFQRANEAKAAAVKIAKEELLDEIAPVSSSSSISRQMVKNAGAAFDTFRKGANKRYTAFREAARAADTEIGTGVTQARAKEVLRNLNSLPVESLKSNDVLELVQDMATINRTGVGRGAVNNPMNFRQWEVTHNKLGDKAAALFKLGRNDDAINILSIKDAMDHDLSASIEALDVVDNAINTTVKNLHGRADSFFHRGLKLFESPTGQKFGRTNKNIFQLGFEKQGSKNIDEMMDAVFNEDSPQAMNDLRRLVGNEQFTKSVRIHVSNALANSIDIVQEGKKAGQVRIQANKLADSLGLFSPKSSKRRALSVALSKSSITVKDLEDFTEALIKVSDSEVINVSDFIARRAMLGGVRGVTGAFTPGVPSIEGSPGNVKELALFAARTATFFLTLGKAGKFLSDPAKLKWATQAMDESVPVAIRRSAAIRLARAVENDIPETVGGGIATGVMQPPGTGFVRARAPGSLLTGQLLEGVLKARGLQFDRRPREGEQQ